MRMICRLLLTGNVFIFLGLCLALAGFCGPAWFRTSYPPGPEPTWTLEEGIWLARFCRHITGECIFTVRERVFSEIGIVRSFSPLDEPHWLEFKVLSVASPLSGITDMMITAVTLTKVNKSEMAPKHLLLISSSAFFSIVSFSMLFVPVFKVTHVTTKFSHFGKAADCWSFVLASTGAACMFAASAAVGLALAKAAFKLCDQKNKSRESHRRRDEQLRRNEIIARYFHGENRAYGSPFDEDSIVNNELRVSTDTDSAYSVISNGGLNDRNTGHALHLPMSSEITTV
ncbi:uncharacterized protein LOC128244967 [Mya arenaria]|uniref:uncharacterized protein LOC128244967 n=1 Tax=Mya arenaria TaxID=6604 RepID=UPI0022E5DC51|nr:uncharacterized protein LOC128244967 [Mya arenaria]